jgi:hypothetical protein
MWGFFLFTKEYMMARHAHTPQPKPTPPAAPTLKKPEGQRTDTAGTQRLTPQPAPAKSSDARSQANPTQLAAPQRRLSPEERFQLTQMRAYYLWEQAGRPEGDTARVTFWLQAEREVGVPRPGA